LNLFANEKRSKYALCARRDQAFFALGRSNLWPDEKTERRTHKGVVMSVISLVGLHELVIIGAGGFGAVAASVADQINADAIAHNRQAPWDVIGYVDRDAAKRGIRHAGHTVCGNLDEVGRDFCEHELWFFCAVGENDARARIVRVAGEFGWKPATLVHPTAIMASNVEIGAGSYVGPLSVISVNTRVGAHVIVDMHVSIGHDAVLSDFCAVFPGARISGCCRVGEYALVGSNATLLPGTVVGDRAVVGASSMASGAVDADTTILGVPARIIYRSTSSLSHR
jgi:sugar O-acyltransferase (sialic acid O-acetyltransferase NeuD family)